MNTSLYRMFDADDGLLYIGISMSVANRLSQHAKDKPWATDIAKITVEHFADRQSALNAETAAIKAENPLYNRDRPDVAPKARRIEGHMVPLMVRISSDDRSRLDAAAKRENISIAKFVREMIDATDEASF